MLFESFDLFSVILQIMAVDPSVYDLVRLGQLIPHQQFMMVYLMLIRDKN